MRILETPDNKISVGVCMGGLLRSDPTFLGSYLFARRVSGLRVVGVNPPKEMAGGLLFKNYGSHC